MIFISDEIKNDPQKRWDLPDETFFAAGACHILAYAFLEKFPDSGYSPIWIKPGEGFRGNHVFTTDGKTVFDYRGYAEKLSFINSLEKELEEMFPGWNYTLIPLRKEALVSEPESKKYEGLWLREPGQFLHDPLPRAFKYLEKLLTTQSEDD